MVNVWEKIDGILGEALDGARQQLDPGRAHQIIMRSIRHLTELAEQIADDESTVASGKPIRIYKRKLRVGYGLGELDGQIAGRLYKERRIRDELFNRQMPSSNMFGEPAWDILLDLLRAEVTRKRVSVTSACLAASVPATTALRWVMYLVDQGLIDRVDDDSDKRRVFVRLTALGSRTMQAYFDRIADLR